MRPNEFDMYISYCLQQIKEANSLGYDFVDIHNTNFNEKLIRLKLENFGYETFTLTNNYMTGCKLIKGFRIYWKNKRRFLLINKVPKFLIDNNQLIDAWIKGYNEA